MTGAEGQDVKDPCQLSFGTCSIPMAGGAPNVTFAKQDCVNTAAR